MNNFATLAENVNTLQEDKNQTENIITREIIEKQAIDRANDTKNYDGQLSTLEYKCYSFMCEPTMYLIITNDKEKKDVIKNTVISVSTNSGYKIVYETDSSIVVAVQATEYNNVQTNYNYITSNIDYMNGLRFASKQGVIVGGVVSVSVGTYLFVKHGVGAALFGGLASGIAANILYTNRKLVM